MGSVTSGAASPRQGTSVFTVARIRDSLAPSLNAVPGHNGDRGSNCRGTVRHSFRSIAPRRPCFGHDT